MKSPLRALLPALILLLPLPAEAAKRKTAKETTKTRAVSVEEVGVLRNEDIRVVQKALFTKKGHHEVGFLLSTQPWDAYAAGFMVGFNSTLNPAENLGLELTVQGGYGFGNGHYKDVSYLASNLRGELTGLAADARRQLIGGAINLVWSPVYAKLAWGRRKVIHFDVYGTLGLHGFLAQQIDETAGFAGVAGPSLGVGLKFFLGKGTMLKVDLRDHISLETRKYTRRFTARNNFQFGLGLAFQVPEKKKG